MNQAKIEALARQITRRNVSLFAAALDANQENLVGQLSGKKVLVVGAGGTIGAYTTLQLVRYPIAKLDLVDISENYLADLIRHIRNLLHVAAHEVRTFVLDYGCPIMGGFLKAQPPYDLILNFAAHKHVRGERDPFTLLSMVDTNIVKHAAFKRFLERGSTTRRYFSVSTDKAANPVSMMGASKRAMEDVSFDYRAAQSHAICTSARFANVAFSNGSLLHAFIDRLNNQQPIAVPSGTRRYFISPIESGHICLLAAVLGVNGGVYVPMLSPEKELITLEECAEIFLDSQGLTAVKLRGPIEALSLASRSPERRYPVLLTPLDTGGEKAYEEFVGRDEVFERSSFCNLGVVMHKPLGDPGNLVSNLGNIVNNATEMDGDRIYKAIERQFRAYIPDFAHISSEKNLDQRL